MESFSFVAPVAYLLELLVYWTDTSRVVTFGIAGVLGMVVGLGRDGARDANVSLGRLHDDRGPRATTSPAAS